MEKPTQIFCRHLKLGSKTKLITLSQTILLVFPKSVKNNIIHSFVLNKSLGIILASPSS